MFILEAHGLRRAGQTGRDPVVCRETGLRAAEAKRATTCPKARSKPLLDQDRLFSRPPSGDLCRLGAFQLAPIPRSARVQLRSSRARNTSPLSSQPREPRRIVQAAICLICRRSLLVQESMERRAWISFASFARTINKTSDVPSSGPPKRTKPSAWRAFIKAAWAGQSSCCSKGSDGFHAGPRERLTAKSRGIRVTSLYGPMMPWCEEKLPIAGCFGGSPDSPALRPRASPGSALGRSQGSSRMNRELSWVYSECRSETGNSFSPLATPINSHACDSLAQLQMLPELRFAPRPSVLR